ncbi:MAG: hypothetical protein SVY53_06270 [Chloroflexota bacterium]|nr:hypothetical protein [Chloroflexota bacterium]
MAFATSLELSEVRRREIQRGLAMAAGGEGKSEILSTNFKTISNLKNRIISTCHCFELWWFGFV